MSKTLVRNRNAACARQHGRCCYCNDPMWTDDLRGFAARFGLSLRQAAQHRCTAEHLHAQWQGGTDHTSNIAAACAWCNHRRHHLRHDSAPDPLTYKRHVQARVAVGKWRSWRLRPGA